MATTIQCSQCGATNAPEFRFCGRCGVPLSPSIVRPAPPPAINDLGTLQVRIRYFVSQGYYLVHADELSAQLIKPKGSLNIAAIVFFGVVFPIISAITMLLYVPLGMFGIGLCSWIMTLVVLSWLSESDHYAYIYIDGADIKTIQRSM
jgi:hypothetical protein